MVIFDLSIFFFKSHDILFVYTYTHIYEHISYFIKISKKTKLTDLEIDEVMTNDPNLPS
jgi:hypothetical protein